jgi:hypothetical protein
MEKVKYPAVRVVFVDGLWEVYARPTEWQSLHLGSYKRSGDAVRRAFTWLAREGLTGWRVYKEGVVVAEVGYE